MANGASTKKRKIANYITLLAFLKKIFMKKSLVKILLFSAVAFVTVAVSCANNDDDTKRFKIAFDPNGGDGVMKTISVLENEAVKLPAVTFTKKGNRFKEWSAVKFVSKKKSNEEVLDTYSDREVIRVDQSVTLIAQWESN